MKTKISDRNTKLGNIPNISLVPVKDCPKNVPCKKDCYACKFFRMYPSVKNAWENNSNMARNHRDEYFADIDSYLTKHNPRFFRWHVAGDILDQDYLDGMKNVARNHGTTKFLAFTKNYGLMFDNIPENLSIIFSVWPGRDIPNHLYPRAYMQDGNEDRIPVNAIECPGLCHNCGMCWNIKSLGVDVYFHKH